MEIKEDANVSELVDQAVLKHSLSESMKEALEIYINRKIPQKPKPEVEKPPEEAKTEPAKDTANKSSSEKVPAFSPSLQKAEEAKTVTTN